MNHHNLSSYPLKSDIKTNFSDKKKIFFGIINKTKAP